MDAGRFDQWTRSLSSISSRRAIGRLLAGGSLGALLAHGGREEAEAKCVAPRKKCKTKQGKRQKCCGGAKCRGNKCQCPRRGKPCGKQCCGKREKCLARKCRPCDVCATGCRFSSLQAAIDAATAGSTIHLCPGTFIGPFTLVKGLTLVGHGAGRTILDGINASRVLHIIAGTTGATIRNLTVTRGSAGSGGGIRNEGSLTLQGVLVSSNDASSSGGGIYNADTLTLDSVSVVSNGSGGNGAGIFNAGPLTINGSTLSGNIASGDGGGIYNFTGSATLQNGTTVVGNSAGGTGGGIHNAAGTVTVEPNNVTGNSPNDCTGTVTNCGP